MHLALLLAFKVRVCSMFKFQVRQTWTHRFKLILNTWVKKCFQFLSQMIQQGRYSPHRPVWQCFLAGGYPKRKPELYGFFSFLSVLQSYYIHLRHQLGMCSDLCIQNQSKTEMTEQIWPLHWYKPWHTIQLLILCQCCPLFWMTNLKFTSWAESNCALLKLIS